MNEVLFSIGRVAEISGSSIKTIRYYHDIGLLPAEKVSSSGRRYYSIQQIWRLQLIVILRHIGFGLSDIRKILGGTDVLKSIEVQIKLIESQIQHQQNILDVLQQALGSGSDEKALQYIHDIGIEIKENLAVRESLMERIESALVEKSAPEDWRAAMLQGFHGLMVPNPSDKQLAAYNELSRLLEQDDTTDEIRKKIEPFWTKIHQESSEATGWQEIMQDIMLRAWANLQNGTGTKDKDLKDLANEFAHASAKFTNTAVTPEFVDGFVEQLTNLCTGSFRRVWELLSIDNPVKPHIVLEAIAHALKPDLKRNERGGATDD